MLQQLNVLSSQVDIKHVIDSEFKKYGKVLEGIPVESLLEKMREFDVPTEGNEYIPSVSGLEEERLIEHISKNYYGSMEIQIGYCNGNNSYLGGLEYHKGSEINIAITDMVLLLGHMNDMEHHTFHSNFLEAFYIPKGYAIELYQTTLHLAPCKVTDSGFKCVVILPKGTNTPLNEKEKNNEDPLLFMRNKWVIAHEDHHRFVSQGAFVGVHGPNVFVPFLNCNEIKGGKL